MNHLGQRPEAQPNSRDKEAPVVDVMRQKLRKIPVARVFGRLTRMKGLILEAGGCQLATGQRCFIDTHSGTRVEAEVVGFSDSTHYLMPLSRTEGLSPGDRVIPMDQDNTIPAGNELLGRVINGLGEPIDGQPLNIKHRVSLSTQPINPLNREPVTQPLDVGVRSINGLLTIGKGQRVGLFAGSGVGKSVLLGMMTRNTTADVTVVGLIGERGREVREFIEQTLGPEGLKNAVVVAAPADESPVLRLRAAKVCHRLAEHFRDQGKSVLLLMDSLTRFAQAQREISLSVGEPPATRGYPPSVFSQISELLERAGNGSKSQGSITAVYTVLMEADDLQDPIADASRATLDGHIVLSRSLADSGLYPAVDIEASISRTMPNVVSEQQQSSARLLKSLYSRYSQSRDLMAVGAYQRGTDQELDRAIDSYPDIHRYLQQGMYEQIPLDTCINQLLQIWPAIPPGATEGQAP
ncbi:flagellar protein export ATPase FliI [Endozoicomonas numazuensis]|nr:flagellar protein export ATPase FliI [Endozoicomonas numazuensis]